MVVNMAYHRHNNNGGPPMSDPFWFAVALIFSAALAAIALPAIIIGFVAQRYLAPRLHWKMSMLIWLMLSLSGGFILWQNYWHGWSLVNEITNVLILYIAQIKHHQADLAQW